MNVTAVTLCLCNKRGAGYCRLEALWSH